MTKKVINALVMVTLLASFVAVIPVSAQPPAPDEEVLPEPSIQPYDKIISAPPRKAKPLDQPNINDYLRNRQRQRLLEAGQLAEASSLALTGEDRVLVLLVEFAGQDVFTWEEGVSEWDPLGIADPNEAVYDINGDLIIGDCTNIITTTNTFTYTGPAHNQIPRPISLDDRSGDSIWTEDFSKEWFEDFMFGEGVVFDYNMQDGTPYYEDFSGQSVTDYYLDMSNGMYTVTGDVIGWLPLDHSTWWYGADECPGRRSPYDANTASSGAIPGAGNSKTLVTDALDAVNVISDTIPGFDWANYDQDHDGIIDRLWIVHSGYGEEDGTTLLNRTDYGESALWSHSSAVSPPYEVAPGISAGPYIMMPENGGIGVFAHEYGHNLGADDLYAYDQGETSTGFWSLMSDDWTGFPIGFEPPAVDPWHLDNWGWLEPMVINDSNQVYEFKLGQASNFPGGDNVYRGAKIQLPDGNSPLPVLPWQGTYYWWGGKLNLSNAMMTTASSIALTSGSSGALSFDLVYDIEDEWDFLWVQVSTDGGSTWDTLTNANTQCLHDPGWIGGLYGFPEDLCGAGMGGFYGYNANWPDPETQQFDLTSYLGQSIDIRLWYMTDWGTLYSGAFVDNLEVTVDTTTVFSDDAESGDSNWVYTEPWIRSDGNQPFTQNIYLQWRNVGDNGGYDSALGDDRWRFGPANTGLLAWYNNNFYTDNEIWHYFDDDPGWGPKGRMLVLDAHPEPYRDPYYIWMGFNNTGANVTSRALMRDAPFSLKDSVDFTMSPDYVFEDTQFSGRPAVSSFHDSMGYYPGAEYVNRGSYYPPDQFKWVTKDWDASAVIPATKLYGINAPGYLANEEFRFNCSPYTSGPFLGALGCYWYGPGAGLPYDGGTGNPGDIAGQYGWHVEILSESEDGTMATVKVWNAMKEVDHNFEVDKSHALRGETVTYDYELTNWGSPINALVCTPVDSNIVEYVPGSATNGSVPLTSSCPPAGTTALALNDLIADEGAPVNAIAWTGGLMTGGKMGFTFQATVTTSQGGHNLAGPVSVFDLADSSMWNWSAEAPEITSDYMIFMPLNYK